MSPLTTVYSICKHCLKNVLSRASVDDRKNVISIEFMECVILHRMCFSMQDIVSIVVLPSP